MKITQIVCIKARGRRKRKRDRERERNLIYVKKEGNLNIKKAAVFNDRRSHRIFKLIVFKLTIGQLLGSIFKLFEVCFSIKIETKRLLSLRFNSNIVRSASHFVSSIII